MQSGVATETVLGHLACENVINNSAHGIHLLHVDDIHRAVDEIGGDFILVQKILKNNFWR